jgi:hypothetical protein
VSAVIARLGSWLRKNSGAKLHRRIFFSIANPCQQISSIPQPIRGRESWHFEEKIEQMPAKALFSL